MNTYEACCWNLKTQTLFFFLTKVNYFRLAEYSGVWLCVIYMQWEVEYLFHIIQTVTARDWGMWTLATTRSHCDNRVVPVSVILDITYDSANDNLITKPLFAKKTFLLKHFKKCCDRAFRTRIVRFYFHWILRTNVSLPARVSFWMTRVLRYYFGNIFIRIFIISCTLYFHIDNIYQWNVICHLWIFAYRT